MTAFLSFNNQIENLGDEVINFVLARELAKRMRLEAFCGGVPDWYLDNLRDGIGDALGNVVFCKNPKLYSARLARAALSPKRSWLFTSCGDRTARKSSYKRDLLLAALQFSPGLRLAVVGAGYSAVAPSRIVLKRCVMKRGGAPTVRDAMSQKLFAEQGLDIPVVPDLALLLPYAAGPGSRYALFSFRQRPGLDYPVLVEQLKAIVARVRAMGLIPTVTWQVLFDSSFCEKLAGDIGADYMPPASPCRGRFKAVTSLCDDAAVIFSNRLHALLIAASRGAVPVAVLAPQERKVRGVFLNTALGDLIVPEGVDGAEKVDAILADLPGARARMSAAFTEGAAVLTNYFDRIAGAKQAGLAKLARADNAV